MIKEEGDILEFLFLGDGAKISRTPLLNILVITKKFPMNVVELVDFEYNIAGGSKKKNLYI